MITTIFTKEQIEEAVITIPFRQAELVFGEGEVSKVYQIELTPEIKAAAVILDVPLRYSSPSYVIPAIPVMLQALSLQVQMTRNLYNE